VCVFCVCVCVCVGGGGGCVRERRLCVSEEKRDVCILPVALSVASFSIDTYLDLNTCW
jgi:hypothetical protein